MRPASHQTGDVGLNAVEKLFLDAGWVVNRIVSDYGEDLSVQTVADGNVEKFRIYVQVKSIKSQKRTAVSLRTDDLFIWNFSKEMFLLVCWLVPQKRAVYQWMNKSRAVQAYAAKNKATASISVAKMKPLDSNALAFIQVESKNLFYDELLGQISKFIDQVRGYRKNRTLPAALNAKSVAVRVACRMLCEEGVLLQKGGCFFPSGVFLNRHLWKILEYRFKHKRAGQRLTSVDWAYGIVSYAWALKYGHLPSDNLMWALVNAVEVVITNNENFRSIVRSFAQARKRRLKIK